MLIINKKMPTSRKYCLSTPIKKWVFHKKQVAKHKGLSKEVQKIIKKNKYVISEKYRKSRRKS